MSSGPLVVKTHLMPRFEAYWDDPETLNTVRREYDRARVIYVRRDGQDVMVSLFHYLTSYDPRYENLDFDSFLRTPNNFDPPPYDEVSRPAFWARHVEQWSQTLRSSDIAICYEDLRCEYQSTMSRLADAIALPTRKEWRDVRMTRRAWYSRIVERVPWFGMKRTSVEFRRGSVGDAGVHFDERTNRYFAEQTRAH